MSKFWGITPDQWDSMKNEDEKAEMIAYYNMENKMSSYEEKLREDRQKRKGTH